jgi:O-methyltransferase involved in polyketide biosynthesis
MDVQLPTIVTWEGATMFSKREVVQETPSLVAKRLGWGSCVAFDCFDSGQGGEPLRFGMHGDKTEKVIKNIGKELSLFGHLRGIEWLAVIFRNTVTIARSVSLATDGDLYCWSFIVHTYL